MGQQTYSIAVGIVAFLLAWSWLAFDTWESNAIRRRIGQKPIRQSRALLYCIVYFLLFIGGAVLLTHL